MSAKLVPVPSNAVIPDRDIDKRPISAVLPPWTISP